MNALRKLAVLNLGVRFSKFKNADFYKGAPRFRQRRLGSVSHHAESHHVDPNDPYDGVEHELVLPPQAHYYAAKILCVLLFLTIPSFSH